MSTNWMMALLLLLEALIFSVKSGNQYYICNMYADDIDNLDENDNDGVNHHHSRHWWFGHWSSNHHVNDGDNTDGYVIARPISVGGFLIPPQSTGTDSDSDSPEWDDALLFQGVSINGIYFDIYDQDNERDGTAMGEPQGEDDDDVHCWGLLWWRCHRRRRTLWWWGHHHSSHSHSHDHNGGDDEWIGRAYQQIDPDMEGYRQYSVPINTGGRLYFTVTTDYYYCDTNIDSD